MSKRKTIVGSSRDNERIIKWHRVVFAGRFIIGMLVLVIFNYASCKYSFKDSSPLPPEVKTFRVNLLGNQAPYVDPQLSPQITEALKQKIISNTRLRQTNDDDAHYDINGFVSNYAVTTTGISGSTASQNRLTVTFHIIFKNTLDNSKNMEADVSSNFDFSSSLSLTDAATQLNTQIVTNMVDQIYNKIFSNW
ncbi:MAG TPA: LPS assembly lipoprotein LptE [Ferruginibacter sp.]|nr:LPS assembly lipoprotein LptE [Ferruginibacter sp.]